MNRQQNTQTGDYQARFDQVQTRFIDEPREAVREAGTLVREAVDRLVGGRPDTEQLRLVMQGYRDLLGRIDGGDRVDRLDRVEGGDRVDRVGGRQRVEGRQRLAENPDVHEERTDS